MPITFGIITPLDPRGKNSTNSQINSGITDENKDSKVQTIETLLDSGASASIVHKDMKYEHHRRNKWSTMAGIFYIL